MSQFRNPLLQQLPPKRRRRWPWIVAFIVVLLVTIAATLGAAFNQQAPTSSVAPTAPVPQVRQTVHETSTQALTPTPFIIPTDTPQPTMAPTPTPTSAPVVIVPTPTPRPVPPTPTPCPGINCNPFGYNFTPGNLIYYPPSNFCSYFNCITSFWEPDDPGDGYVVQCVDGLFSQSGSERGACSGHGGVGKTLYSH